MLTAITDDEAIGRVRSGDKNSYGVLAARYDVRLRQVAKRLLRSDADAEDAVQGAHVSALTHIDQYAGTSGYFAWMYSIVVNEALTQIRKRKRLIAIDDAAAGQISSPLPDPEERTVDQDFEYILECAVTRLPPSYQPVFRLREMEDLSTAETGERLGLSEACVKTRLFRARDILRKRLRPVLKNGSGGL